MFLGKGVLKLCSKFTGEQHPCRSGSTASGSTHFQQRPHCVKSVQIRSNFWSGF